MSSPSVVPTLYSLGTLLGGSPRLGNPRPILLDRLRGIPPCHRHHTQGSILDLHRHCRSPMSRILGLRGMPPDRSLARNGTRYQHRGSHSLALARNHSLKANPLAAAALRLQLRQKASRHTLNKRLDARHPQLDIHIYMFSLARLLSCWSLTSCRSVASYFVAPLLLG